MYPEKTTEALRACFQLTYEQISFWAETNLHESLTRVHYEFTLQLWLTLAGPIATFKICTECGSKHVPHTHPATLTRHYNVSAVAGGDDQLLQ